MAKEQKQQKDSGKFFFICNPKYIKTHRKYVRHQSLTDAMAEAVRLSKGHEGEQFFVYEGAPLGQVVNGKPVA